MPRNKGSLNKVTQDTKKVLQTVLEGQIDRIELALDDVYERNTVTYLQIITAPSIPPSKGYRGHYNKLFKKTTFLV